MILFLIHPLCLQRVPPLYFWSFLVYVATLARGDMSVVFKRYDDITINMYDLYHLSILSGCDNFVMAEGRTLRETKLHSEHHLVTFSPPLNKPSFSHSSSIYRF